MHYLHYNREQLDLQYNARAGVPRFQEYFDRWRKQAEQYRRQFDVRSNLHYGAHHLQSLDYFPAGQKDAPLLVFIHGGYWRSLDKDDFSQIAAPFREDGVNVAILNYRLAPHFDIQDIVSDVRAGFAWLFRQASTYDFDTDRVVVAGHSAGGHLAAMLGCTDWRALRLPSDAVKGFCGVSGIYDLEPIRLSYLNETLKLDVVQVQQFSPLYNMPLSPGPVLLAVGGSESKEFHRQLAVYAQRLTAFGCPVRMIKPDGCNHFDVIDQLADGHGELVRALIAMIGS